MTTVSLFCGAGGESAGKAAAMASLGLTAEVSHAVNHWDLAVQVHGHNFPNVMVHQEDITQVTAADFGLTAISLLWASPSCVHHSRARGGKPREEQQRSHACEVLDRWVRIAKVDVLLVENVPEFVEWGPLDDAGQPIVSRKGEDFRAFVDDLKSMGYAVEWRVLCAADYGDPTTRRRFFMQAVKDGVAITWPEQSHRSPKAARGLFDADLPPWRTAAECIDWSIPCPSIFGRKKPLAENTLSRIRAGIQKFVLHGRPFIVDLAGEQAAASLIQYHSTYKGGRERVQGIEEPIATLDTSNRYGLVAAFLVGIDNASSASIWPADEPLSTATTKARHTVVSAFLTQYYGNGGASPVTDPLATVTTKDRHSLVTITLDGKNYAIVDIGLRMLQPHELAKAMGFPDTYEFARMDGGNLTTADKVKMIGNACPVGTVSALIRNVLAPRMASYRSAA
jgi:DNA (cytosine-5)-methyltransferase 1